MSQSPAELLRPDSELSPAEIIETLRARAAIEPDALNTAELYRYVDENNFAALAFALVEGLIEQEVLPPQPLLDDVYGRPIVFTSVYTRPDEEPKFRFETELYRRPPTDEQRKSAPEGQTAMGDPSQIRLRRWANEIQEYGLIWPIKPDFSHDPSREIILERTTFGAGPGRLEAHNLEIGGQKKTSSLAMKSPANTVNQAMKDLADVAALKLVEAKEAESAAQGELHIRAIGSLAGQSVETQPVEAASES